MFFIWRRAIISRLMSPSPSMYAVSFHLSCIPLPGLSLLAAAVVPSQAGGGSWEEEEVTACSTGACNASTQISHFVAQSKEHIFNSVSQQTPQPVMSPWFMYLSPVFLPGSFLLFISTWKPQHTWNLSNGFHLYPEISVLIIHFYPIISSFSETSQQAYNFCLMNTSMTRFHEIWMISKAATELPLSPMSLYLEEGYSYLSYGTWDLLLSSHFK